jgi:hypothetical protein
MTSVIETRHSNYSKAVTRQKEKKNMMSRFGVSTRKMTGFFNAARSCIFCHPCNNKLYDNSEIITFASRPRVYYGPAYLSQESAYTFVTYEYYTYLYSIRVQWFPAQTQTEITFTHCAVETRPKSIRLRIRCLYSLHLRSSYTLRL